MHFVMICEPHNTREPVVNRQAPQELPHNAVPVAERKPSSTLGSVPTQRPQWQVEVQPVRPVVFLMGHGFSYTIWRLLVSLRPRHMATFQRSQRL